MGVSGWSVQREGLAQWCWPILNSLHAACTHGQTCAYSHTSAPPPPPPHHTTTTTTTTHHTQHRRLSQEFPTRAAVDRCGPGHVHSPLSPTGTEDGQGQGGGARGQARRATATEAPPPSRCSSACTTKSPAGGGVPAWQSRRCHRSESRSAPWSPCSSSLSTFLCRRQWTSWICPRSPTSPSQSR